MTIKEKQEKNARIRNALVDRDLYRAATFTARELEDIARAAGVDVLDVMYFARYKRGTR